MKFTTIITFLILTVALSQHHKTLLETILKFKGNYFNKLNDDFQNLINNLFDALHLDTSFLNKTRTKLLLAMHFDLKTVVENNYEVYETMQHIAKLANGNKTKVDLFELIEEILNDNEFNRSNIIKQNTISRKRTKHKLEFNFTTTPLFRDSEEFDEFIKDFVAKIDKITIKDFREKPEPEPILPKHSIATNENEDDDFAEDNLEIWRPPPVIELDNINETIENRRIFQGKKTRIKSFPFMASIHLMGAFACAGSIISKDLILSAASCLQLLYNNRFYRENPKSLSVRIGSDYVSVGGEVIEVLETYFHPSYDPKTLTNNLVILRMRRLISFYKGQKRIRRILYDRSPHHLSVNTDGILILGWGSKKRTQVIDQFQKLLVSRLDFYHNDNCAEIYSSHYVTDLHFCAGFMSTGGGACNKDLGGPGVVAGKLIGVISFGAPVCGTVDAPTVFTKLGFYSSWIDSIMRLKPPVIGAQTTTRPRYRPRNVVYPTVTVRKLVSPVTQRASYRAEQISQKPQGQKDLLEKLSKNSSLVVDLYAYGDEDMLKPPEVIDVMQHPLINKSLFIIPDIHTLRSAITPINEVTTPVTEDTTAYKSEFTTRYTTETRITGTTDIPKRPLQSPATPEPQGAETETSTTERITYDYETAPWTDLITIPTLPSIPPEAFYDSDETIPPTALPIKPIYYGSEYYASYERLKSKFPIITISTLTPPGHKGTQTGKKPIVKPKGTTKQTPKIRTNEERKEIHKMRKMRKLRKLRKIRKLRQRAKKRLYMRGGSKAYESNQYSGYTNISMEPINQYSHHYYANDYYNME